MTTEAVHKAIESMPVLVICPVCGDSTIAKDLKTLDDTIHKLWQLSSNWMKEDFGEQETAKALASAGIVINKDKMDSSVKI